MHRYTSLARLQCPMHRRTARLQRAGLPAAILFATAWLITIVLPRSWEIPGQLGMVAVLTGLGIVAAWELWGIAHQCPTPCTCSTDSTDSTEQGE